MDYDLDSAFLYGESIFTTCKVVSGDIYDWDEHLEKLLDGVRNYFFEESTLKIKSEIVQKLDIKAFTGAIRFTVFKNKDQELAVNFSRRSMSKFEKKPVILKLVKRVQSELLDEFKVGSYGKEFYLKRLMAQEGADDILFYGEGKVFETSVANIFFRSGATTFTPKSGIYKGITREKLIEKYNIIEKDILVSELDSFDEIFLGSSLYEKVEVKEIIR
jgi:branched-subunit amino acid aminotransferase/4-amino-4-deoxychorismate lyase